MTKEKAKEPQIRFKGFTNAWEQRKLGEYLEVSPKKNKEETYDKTDVLSVSGDVGIVNQIEFQGRSFAGVSVANYGVVENEDVVYTKSPLKANPYGIIKTNKGKAGIVSTLYAVYKPRDITDPKFVQVYFEQDTRMNNYMRPLVNKGAKNDMKVSNENALKGLVIFPKLEEQRQISTYFESFDHLITLHQRKCDLLSKAKKTLLQKMFPKNGKTTPEIRFKGFTGAWEQRKLGEVFTERSERSGEGELISVTINSGVVKASELDRKDNSSDNKSNYKKVKVGDIAYNSMRMWQGASGYSLYDGILSPAYTVIIPRKNVESKFFAYDFKRHEMIQTFKRNSQGLTSDTWNLKFPTLKTVKVMVPSFNEQRKISAFFERLDYLITLHQHELEKLQNIKKSCLKMMFV
ncbi:restriction endonuclease subunit S [Eubacterium callanderi]|uniref:restriction endonuclease subunit S n=1 Tax=Eubacterium callanderi TaxID=53442 RepID=UPI0022DEE12F|nr:restriction endonuclease subunit S [Eubacterium callanderi]